MPDDKRLSSKGVKEDRVSRLQKMRVDRKEPFYQPAMPQCDAPHLYQYLMDAGPVLPGGMGAIPLDELSLQAWQWNTGIELLPWQSRYLKRLSADYLVELRAAEKVDRPPPWQYVEPAEEERATLAKRIRAFLRDL